MRSQPACIVAVALAAIWSAPLHADGAGAPRQQPAPQAAAATNQTAVINRYRNLPLRFEPNRGQTDGRAKFLARYGTHDLFLTSTGAILTVNPDGDLRRESALRLTWIGANRRANIVGVDELPGKTNYLVGDRARWRTGIPSYARVQYGNLYPGVDLVYYGDDGRLEYDMVLAPGVAPDRIRFRIDGADRVDVNPSGDLVLRVGGADVRLRKPVAYQTIPASGRGAGARVDVSARYVRTRRGDIRFALGRYDRSRPVVIDPQLVYSTYLGGSGSDSGWKVAVDASGYAYLTGWSRSIDFPLVSPYQSTINSTTTAVVVKLNPKLPGAASLLYSTYLGGSGDSAGRGIAVDASGDIFVGGDTAAPDFPVTAGAYQTACKLSGTSCSNDLFAAKLNPAGSTLLYSTYIGGTGTEYGYGLAIDGAGHMFVTGPTGSSDFPTTPGAYQPTFAGGDTTNGDAYVVEINPAGAGTKDLVYSTYLGGSATETGWAIAVDQSGSIYVAGNTTSPDFPTTASAYSRALSGVGASGLGDAFVAKLRPGGAGVADLLYSTYLGGTDDDRVEGVAVDSSNTAYITGFTTSSDFPVTANAYQTVFGGGTCYGGPCADAFVARLDPASSGAASLYYSTYFGGSSFDEGHAIAVDSSGFVYIAGETASTNLPLVNPIQSVCTGGCTPLPMTDVMLAKFDLSQSGKAGLLFSTYLGGSDVDTAWGVAVDGSGDAFVTGQVFSSNFPTVIPFQSFCNACSPYAGATPSGDLFFFKVCTTNCPAASLSPGSLTFASQTVGTRSTAQVVTLLNPGRGDLTITGISIAGANAADFSQTNNCPVVLPPQGTCAVSVTFAPTGSGTRTATVSAADNAATSPQTVSLSGTATQPTVTPWPNGYSYEATFTVTAGQVPSTQMNFPAVIAGTFLDWKTIANGGRIANTCTQAAGTSSVTVPCDLIFTSDAAGTTKLNWEFEAYNAATGGATVWVQVPSLASGTVVYAWYGNTAVTTLQTTPALTWGTTYTAVYHLWQNPTSAAPQVTDATGGGHDGTLSGSVVSSEQQPGQIAGSLNFGTNQAWASLGNATDFGFDRADAFSLSAWVNFPANGSGTLVSKIDSSSTTGWALYQFATATTPRLALGLQGNGGANNFAMAATGPLTTGVWHHVVVTYAGTSTVAGMKIYVDGVSQALTMISDTLTVSLLNTQPAAINGRGGSTNMSTDALDEIRVSKKGVVLAPDWVTTSYNNQRSPAAFFSVTTGLTNSSGLPFVTLSPSSITFASQTTNTTSAAQSVTVTNNGPGALTISSVAMTGTNRGDFAATTTCPIGPATLAAGASCSVSVTFTPTATGTRTAALSITDNGSGSPQTASLTGTGVAPAPVVSLAPTSLTFASQTTGTTSGAQTITVTNNGPGALTISSIGVTGASAGDFAATTTCPLSPATLAASSACSVNVTFTPTATGSRTAALSITDNGAGSPQAASLTGTGVAPTVTPWPNGYSYEATFTVAAGQVPSAQTNFPALISGTFLDWKTMSNGGRIANTCTQPAGTSVLTVPCDLIFTSDAAGTSRLNWDFEAYNAATGAATVWVQVPNLATGTVVYAWYGNSAVATTQTTPSLTWSGSYTAVYHLWQLASAAAPQLTDSSGGGHDGTLTGTALQQPGEIAGSLNFQNTGAWASLGNATDFGFDRADAFSLSAWVNFPANGSGTLVSKIDSSSTTGWALYQFATATTPRLALGLQGNGGANNFAMAATGPLTTGVWHHVVVTYAGTSTVAGMKIYVDGVSQALTTISDTLTVSLLNAQPAVLNGRGGSTDPSSDALDEIRVSKKGVVFAPDWVTTSYNNQRSPASFFSVTTGLTNTGGGSAPVVTLSPSSLTYASQTTNTTSAAQTITVTNTGPGTLTISSVGVTGANAADFAATTTCPVSPATLAVNGTCAVSVTFTPRATGTRTAAISIADNGAGSPQTAALSGTGVAPVITPWPNGYSYEATFTVAAGQVPSTQTNFPVVISGTFLDWKTIANGGRIANTCTQAAGTSSLTVPCDLIFTSDAAGTTKVNWEFEAYNAATGAATVWVQVPSVATGTVVYAWYGNTAVTTLQTTPALTWGTTYTAVYHLWQNPTSAAPQLTDATGGGHDGTLSGTVAASEQQPGQIGGSLDFSVNQAWASLGKATDLGFERTDSFSLAMWVKTTSDTSGTLLSKVDSTSTTGWGVYQFGTATTPRFALGLLGDGNSSNYAMVATDAISSGVWHYIVVTYTGTSTAAGMKMYVDGVSQALTTISDTLTVSLLNTQPAAINGRGGSTNMSTDALDEIRVSKKGVVLAPDWVTTSYNNQRSPASFFTVTTGLTKP